MKRIHQFLIFTLLALALPAVAAAQYSRYDNVVYGSRGYAVGNQNIAICSQPATTTSQPCSPLATIYSSSSGATASNPIVAGSSLEDAYGNFHFYAATGTYTIQIYGPQVNGQIVMVDQTIGACIPPLACTVSGLWNFTGGLENNGYAVIDTTDVQTMANKTLTSPTINTPTITSPSTTGTDSGTETLSNKTLAGAALTGALTGTGAYLPTSLFNSGTGAGSSTFWRGDGTWAAASGGVAEATWSASCYAPSTTTCEMEVNGAVIGQVILPSNHTLLRFDLSVNTLPSGCSTYPVLTFEDLTASSALASLTFSASTGFVDSGALSVSMTGGDQFGFKVTTIESGCSTVPNFWVATAVYK